MLVMIMGVFGILLVVFFEGDDFFGVILFDNFCCYDSVFYNGSVDFCVNYENFGEFDFGVCFVFQFFNCNDVVGGYVVLFIVGFDDCEYFLIFYVCFGFFFVFYKSGCFFIS